MTLDTKRLREVAEAAGGGRWEAKRIAGFDEIAISCGFDTIAFSSSPDAEHIATFDPPTVLALLDEVERLRAALDVERLAEALSWVCGDMTRYDETAHPDHNRWSWRGDGHGDALRNEHRARARTLREALGVAE